MTDNQKSGKWNTLISDIYELNRRFYSNTALISIGTLLYIFYYAFEPLAVKSIDAYAYIDFINKIFSAIIAFLYAALLMTLVVYSTGRRIRRLYIIMSMTLYGTIISIININMLAVFDTVADQSYIGMFNFLLTMQQSFLLISLYYMLKPGNKNDASKREKIMLLFAVPVMLVSFTVIMRFSVDVGFIQFTQSNELKFVILFLNFVLTVMSICLPVRFLYLYERDDNDGKNNGFLVEIIGVFLVFIINQIVILNSTGDFKPDVMVFQIFKIIGMSMLLKAFYREYILGILMNTKREESQLRLYVEKLNRVVERNTEEIRVKSDIIVNELEYARAIQQSLLPSSPFKGSGKCMFEMGYFPCERLSGDFCDFFQVDEENYAFYIMDVSGHGIPAALLTMVAKNAFSDFSGSKKRRERALHPHFMLADLYEEFNRLRLPDEMHFVIFYASYNTRTRELKYTSGGMNCSPILIKSDGKIFRLDESKGFPICKLGDLFVPEYSVTNLDVEEGDTIVLYTDGLVDFQKNRLMDEDTLIRLMVENRHLTLEELGRLMKKIIGPGTDELKDDITYLIMRTG